MLAQLTGGPQTAPSLGSLYSQWEGTKGILELHSKKDSYREGEEQDRSPEKV